MTPKEVNEALVAQGLKLDAAYRNMNALKAFYKHMERRQYGSSQTTNAYMWFETGWNSAKELL